MDGTSEPPATKAREVEDPCLLSGSIIGCENQSLGEVIGLAGTAYRLHYQSDRTEGTSGVNPVAVGYAQGLGGWTLNVHHRYDPASNTLYLGTGASRNAASLGAVVQSSSNHYLIAAEDGQVIYEFDANGLHTRTLHGLTGTPLLTFSYVTGSEALLTVTDDHGNTVRFTRNSSGGLLAVSGPYGATSVVSLDKKGYLKTLKNPAGETTKAKYSDTGLLLAFTTPRGATSTFVYDKAGLLIQDKSAGGNAQKLARNAQGTEVTHTSPMGRTTQFQADTLNDGSVHRKVTEASGLSKTMNQESDLSESSTLSNGIQLASTSEPDPRFGQSARTLASYQVVTPSGLASSTTSNRTVSLFDPADPLSLSQLQETAVVNGKSFSSHYDAATHTITTTSPSGRVTTKALDTLGQVLSSQTGSLNSSAFSYDSHGRVTAVQSGTGSDEHKATFSYDPMGYLQGVTDNLGQSISLQRDLSGRVTQQTYPDGRTAQFGYDKDGHLLRVTNPQGASTRLSYTKDGQLASVLLPSAPGAKSKQGFVYNGDGQLQQLTRLDGNRLNYQYDMAGRLTGLGTDTAHWTFGYHGTYGYLETLTTPGGVNTRISRDGDLLTQMSWSGPITGNVAYGYNPDFQLSDIEVNGSASITYEYDNDGLLASAGSLSLERDPASGLVTGKSLGHIQDQSTYDGFGRVTRYEARFDSTPLMTVDYQYDSLDRITQITEQVAGNSATTQRFSYDAAGRLVSAASGSVTRAYGYDKNGNRLTAQATGGSILTGQYDAQDRILRYGEVAYGYTTNGEISQIKNKAGIMGLEYDLLGHLSGATLNNGDHVMYILDGFGNRIGKQLNGNLTRGWLYQDRLKPVAELDGNGNIISRFVYVDHLNVPDYMIQSGGTYRILSDHQGSPRLVVNIDNGTIAQRMDYDEFGNIIQDTNPGFQPFGFQGGLYDVHTQLLHFGDREFDSRTGRWTSRDPILFSSGGYNAYANLNDPVNRADPTGRWSVSLGPFSFGYENGEFQISTGVSKSIDNKGVPVAEFGVEVSVSMKNEPIPVNFDPERGKIGLLRSKLYAKVAEVFCREKVVDEVRVGFPNKYVEVMDTNHKTAPLTDGSD